MPPRLTPVEIHLEILLVDVGRHGYNGRIWLHLFNHGGGRDTVKLGHDDIHEDQIVGVLPRINFVYSFKTIALTDVSHGA
jgi:hypothetical protein